MVVETEHGHYGFVVDEVLGDHQTVIKNLGRLYRNVQVVSGATILGNGTVALILDPHRLVQNAVQATSQNKRSDGRSGATVAQARISTDERIHSKGKQNQWYVKQTARTDRRAPAMAVQPFWNTARSERARAGSASKAADVEMQRVSQEILRLVEASRQGRLDERGKADQFHGVHREMVQGINEMLDAILLPIGEGNRILAQISERQDRRADRPNLQGRSREDEAGRQQRGHGAAGPAEGTDAADRRLQRRTALRARQAGAVPGRLCRHRARRERHAGCDSAADRRRQPHSGPDFRRQDRRADRANLQGRSREDEAGRQQRGHGGAEPAEGTDAADRCLAGKDNSPSAASRTVPGRVCRHRARRERHAGRDSAAHRRRQPHSGADLQRQDRRADRANLQGRSRKDEAGRQQRGRGRAEPAEGTDAPDRRLQGRTALRARQAGAFPGRVRRHRARRERHAGRDSAAHRRRQPHSGADLQRQDRRADRADLQGRSRKDEAGGQQRGRGPAGLCRRNWPA